MGRLGKWWHDHFRWYDMWIGAYWDEKTRTLYICPLPMIVFRPFDRKERTAAHDGAGDAPGDKTPIGQIDFMMDVLRPNTGTRSPAALAECWLVLRRLRMDVVALQERNQAVQHDGAGE